MATTTDREKLIADLNGDLSREYQAIIAYTVYSQVRAPSADELGASGAAVNSPELDPYLADFVRSHRPARPARDRLSRLLRRAADRLR